MFCEYCGARIDEGDLFCYVCGERVDRPANRMEEQKSKDLISDKSSEDAAGNISKMHNIQLPIGTIIRQRYKIQDIIGRGGFCYTYRALDTLLGVEVAVKEYFPKNIVSRYEGESVTVEPGENHEKYLQGKIRFLKEARNLAKFNGNPGIVTIYDFFDENNTAYIIMEYLKGQNIGQYMKYIGGIPEYTFTAYVADKICDVLDQIHKQGIVHRDLSPDNIFLCEDGDVKLIDFGAVAKRNDVNKESIEVILKPGYAPPEQYDKNGSIGNWTDIYALGATLYKMTTGKVPQESIVRQNNDNLVSPIQLNSEIPMVFSDAIMQALNLDANYRFSNASDFKAALFTNNTASQELQRTEYEVSNVYDQAKMNGMASGILTSTSVLTSTGYVGSDILAQTGGLYGYVNAYDSSLNNDLIYPQEKGSKYIGYLLVGLVSLLVLVLIFLIVFLIFFY